MPVERTRFARRSPAAFAALADRSGDETASSPALKGVNDGYR
jgi:hypothetical protein